MYTHVLSSADTDTNTGDVNIYYVNNMISI